jgi:hypothetical protein
MLIVIGAVLGGLLGPIFMIVDGWIGMTPGAKQQKANYAVQREIAESLRTLVTYKLTTRANPAGGIRADSRSPRHDE